LIYDLIVIGDDLSSYVAAALASDRGLKTVLLSEIGIGDLLTIGDTSFNIDFTPLSGIVFSDAGIAVLKDLGISHKISLLDPAYQVILPQHRIDFFHSKDMLIHEMTREFPDEAADIKFLYDCVEKASEIVREWLNDHPYVRPHQFKEYLDYLKLTPHLMKGIMDSMKLKKAISQNLAFKRAIEAQQILLSFSRNNHHPIFSFFLLAAPWLGFGYLPLGKQTLLDAAIHKIVSLNGIYLRNCETLSIKKDKPYKVIYNDEGGIAAEIDAHHMIVSTKWQSRHLLTDKKKYLSLEDRIRPTKISHLPLTIHLSVRPGCIPEKMARHVVVVNDLKRDVQDDNLMILYSGTENDKDLTQKQIPLSVTSFFPSAPSFWLQDVLMQKAEQMITRLECFLPFLKENIEFIDIEASIEFSKRQQQIINPQYQLRRSWLTGFAAKDNRTRFKDLYLTGASLLLDIGLDGEIMSGMNAVDRLLQKK